MAFLATASRSGGPRVIAKRKRKMSAQFARRGSVVLGCPEIPAREVSTGKTERFRKII